MTTPAVPLAHSNDPADAAAGTRSRAHTGQGLLVSARDYIALTKPGIVAMTLVTAGWGLGLAPTRLSPNTIAAALLGTALSVGSANAFNMVLERDSDGLMERTRDRPLPRRRIAARGAWVFATTGGVLSFAVMALAVNLLTALLSAFALLTYAFVYTPLKSRTTLALPIGAVAGAMPPLLGWTAATGQIDLTGAMLFFVLFWWQIPHFVAISMFRFDDYVAAGIKTIPACHGDLVARASMIATSLALLASTLALVVTGATGHVFAVATVVSGAWLLASAFRVRRAPDALGARRFFRSTLIYLPALALGLLVDGWLG